MCAPTNPASASLNDVLCSERDAAVANLKSQIEAERNQIAREQARLDGGVGPVKAAELKREITQREQMIDSMDEQILQLGRTPCD
jgi:predicted  nucleic acid-binding Zn-ribbon protein